jgi:hypothetical protein
MSTLFGLVRFDKANQQIGQRCQVNLAISG